MKSSFMQGLRLYRESKARGGLSVNDYILWMELRRRGVLGPEPIDADALRKRQEKEKAVLRGRRVSHAGRTARRLEEEEYLKRLAAGEVKSRTLGRPALTPLSGKPVGISDNSKSFWAGNTFGNFPSA